MPNVQQVVVGVVVVVGVGVGATGCRAVLLTPAFPPALPGCSTTSITGGAIHAKRKSSSSSSSSGSRSRIVLGYVRVGVDVVLAASRVELFIPNVGVVDGVEV
jgi:hypothetical protein